MQCPTCLQKIIAPQAPASGEQKFIFTGKKTESQLKNPLAAGSGPVAPPRKSFPVAAVLLWAFILVCGAAAYAFRAQLFGSKSIAAPKPPALAAAAKPLPPPLIAPPANDTNWMLAVEKLDFPETPAAGRIHGQDFLCQRAYLQGGVLTLREGTKGGTDFGVAINFDGAAPDALSGQTISVGTNAPKAAAVTLRWKDGGEVVKANYDSGYALRLEFGDLAGNHLPGKIYLCAPDDSKSYLAGSFLAEIRKFKPPKAKVPPGT